MIDILQKACEDKILIAIYTNRDDYDKFSAGYVLDVSEEELLIKHLTPNGEFDGYSVRKTDSVYRVESNSLYLDKVKKLFELKKESASLPDIDTNEDILLNTIKFAMNNNFVVTICIGENACDITGYIKNINDGNIKILQISEYGQNDGETIFLLQDILKICVCDTECRDLDILYRNK